MNEYSILQFAGIDFPFSISFGKTIADFPTHTHGFTELTIVVGGNCEHEVGRTSYTIGKGEVYVIHPSVEHGLRNVKELQLYNFIFDLTKLMLLDSELKKLPGFQVLFILESFSKYSGEYTSRMTLNNEQLNFVISICRIIEKEYKDKREGYRIIIKAYFLALISFLSRNLVPDKEGISEKFFKIAETITYIEDKYKERITLKELSQMAFLSERQYSRIFKAIYNESPINYVINLRLGHACEYICNTQMSLKEILGKCGFSDKAAFSRLFKQRYGITAGKYRKLNNPKQKTEN